MKRRWILAAFVVVAATGWAGLGRAAGSGPAPQPAATTLRATLWAQTAAEYRASTIQAYRLARRLLDEGLANPCWTADVDQYRAGRYAWKPPAVVLDVDETVLDNSPFQARLLQGALADPSKSEAFDPKAWGAWVDERKAAALAGAREFLAYAACRGVEAFFVTNRADDHCAATADNLRAAGIPTDDAHVICKGPQDTSDKGSRRARVGLTHRILLLVGDDFGDFASGVRGVSVEERRRILDAHADWFGTRWIVLPNPTYGSWLDALGPDPASHLRPN